MRRRFEELREKEETFSLTEEHIALLRSAIVRWDSSESGGPYIAEHRGGGRDGDLAQKLAPEMGSALEITLSFGVLEAGTYAYPNPLASSEVPERWRIDSDSDETMPVRKEPVVTFALTQDHLRLLRASSAGWLSYMGAPGIDSKRPYGDMSCFYLDMARLLDEAPGASAGGGCEDRFTASQRSRFDALHRSMVYALQTYLVHVRQDPGVFTRKPAGFGVWRRQ